MCWFSVSRSVGNERHRGMPGGDLPLFRKEFSSAIVFCTEIGGKWPASGIMDIMVCLVAIFNCFNWNFQMPWSACAVSRLLCADGQNPIEQVSRIWRTLCLSCPSCSTKTCKKRSCFETSSKLLPLLMTLMTLMMVNLLALHDVSQRCSLSFPATAKRPARDVTGESRRPWLDCIQNCWKHPGSIFDGLWMLMKCLWSLTIFKNGQYG